MKYKIVLALLILASAIWGNYKENFDFGVRMYGDGLYEEAIRIFEDVMHDAPTSSEAEESLFYIGECLRQQGQLREAENRFKQLYENFPQSSKRDRALYHFALVQHMQKRYAEAAKSFDQLIAQYPLSDYTRQALVIYIEGLYDSGMDNQVITRADEFIDNYPENPDQAQILLISAKSLLRSKATGEARKRLDRIIKDFPNHDARWEAYGIQLNAMVREDGTQKAIASLFATLSDDVPRKHEEQLRFRLVRYYFDTLDYASAYRELETLTSRFDQSANLDEYITWLTRSRLELGKYREILNNAEGYAKVFKESPLKLRQEYYTIRAQYLSGSYDQAEQEADKLLLKTRSDSLQYDIHYLIADIHRDMGRFNDAIRDYLLLINRYPQFGQTDRINMQLGDIYFENFQEYGTALRYYRQVASGSDDFTLQNRALRRMALCYEQQERYQDAVDALEQINLQMLSKTDRFEVENRIEYLIRYRITDYRAAFSNMLLAMNQYLQTEDKTALRNSMGQILAMDVKDIDQALALTRNPQKISEAYARAKILLQLYDRKLRENDTAALASISAQIDSVRMIVMASSDLRNTQEIDIEMDYLKSTRKPDDQLLTRMQDFIRMFPDASAAQWMRLSAANALFTRGDTLKAIDYLDALQNDPSVGILQFKEAKKVAAEYYYKHDQFDKAISNYRLAADRIDIGAPQTLYRFAMALGKIGETEESLQKMAFLINNSNGFPQYEAAIEYVAQQYRARGDNQSALKYLLLTPEAGRNDEFYLLLSDTYLDLHDKTKAKESLMHIENKDVPTLRNLAKLQMETGDEAFANYTLEQLIDKDAVNAWKYQANIGAIAYKVEDYRKASSAFDKLFVKGDQDIKALVEQEATDYILMAVISAYRIENRPKAEKLYDRFEKDIEATPSREAEIRLNEGIYYVGMDAGKAESILGKLIKRDDTPTDIKAQAYLWRGTANIKRKKDDDAKADLDKAISIGSSEVKKQANFKLGNLLFTTEDYENALTRYYYVIENDSTGTLAKDAARNFALVCKAIGEWEKAVSAYEIILERWGDQDMQAETLFDIGYCYYRDRKYNRAVETFQKAIPILENPEMKAEAQYWIGQSYFDDEAWESAVTAWLRVSYNYPNITQWAAVSELKSGEAYLMMRNIEKARLIFEKVVQKYGAGSDWGKEAAKKLKEI